jgi:hypothetical protein
MDLLYLQSIRVHFLVCLVLMRKNFIVYDHLTHRKIIFLVNFYHSTEMIHVIFGAIKLESNEF